MSAKWRPSTNAIHSLYELAFTAIAPFCHYVAVQVEYAVKSAFFYTLTLRQEQQVVYNSAQCQSAFAVRCTNDGLYRPPSAIPATSIIKRNRLVYRDGDIYGYGQIWRL